MNTITKPFIQIDQAVDILEQMIRHCRAGQPRPKFELESRLGRLVATPQGHRFVPGVSPDEWGRILQMLHSFKYWDSIDNWREMNVTFYKVGEQMYRTSFISSTDGHEEPKVETLIKHKIDSIDFVQQQRIPLQPQTTMEHQPQQPLQHQQPQQPQQILQNHLVEHVRQQQDENVEPSAIRVSIAEEIQVDPKNIPNMVNPSFVRIMQRKSFYYRPRDLDRALWRFDCSMVWSGSSKSDAEEKQRTQLPDCEVEVECLDIDYILNHYQRNENLIAESLLVKTCDLLPNSPSAINMMRPNQSRPDCPIKYLLAPVFRY